MIWLQPHRTFYLGLRPQAHRHRQRHRKMNIAKDVFVEVIEPNTIVAERMQLSRRMPTARMVHWWA